MSTGPWIRWSPLEIEAIIEVVASTDKPLKQILIERGHTRQKCYVNFCKTLRRQPVWGNLYVRARHSKVARMQAQFTGMPDEALKALGKRGRNRAMHAIYNSRLYSERSAYEARNKAERTALDPEGEALKEARKRAKKAARQTPA